MAYTVSKLLEIARAELGYKEKETNSQLDDKTANAGDGNWTKYARDLHSAGYYQAAKNGYAWCDMFVDWCFWKLGGSKEKGEWLECQTGLYGAGCEWSSDCYRRAGRFDKNPRPGDQIFFGKTDAEEHTGIVEKIEDGKVHTIEGNASNMCKRCTYSLTSSRIVGYGHPRFDDEPEVEEEDELITGTPSTGSVADEKTIWNFLMVHIDNEYGVAGLMGNLYAESALRSNNLQQSYETKLGYNDTTYTAAVDNGSYDNFVKDAAGYGLAQWTYWSRKQAMLEFHQSKKKSIGDLQTQLEFLIKELSGSYKGVWSDLKNATSILDASNSVLLKFERPANQGESVQKKRAEYGQKYYDKYADEAPATQPEVPSTPAETEFKVGDIVNFNGTNHYASANASTGPKVKASKAKITAIHKSGKHPYHCRAVNDAGNFIGGVYGWVNAADLSAIVAETPAPKPTTPTTPATPAAIKKGDIVSIAKNATYYSGKDIPDWVVAKTWIVAETPVGDRVVINKSVDGKHAINSPVHAKFLTVVKADEPWTPKVGDIVNYNGNKHYANANAANGSSCKGGLAKITNIYQLGKSKHPYHLVRVSGKGATVYGWVNEGTFTKA